MNNSRSCLAIAWNEQLKSFYNELFLADYDKVPKIRDEFVTRVWCAAERNDLNIPFLIRTVHHNPPTKISSTEVVVDGYRSQMRDLPSFASVNQEILAELARCASNRFFGEGEKAIAQGRHFEEFYIIVSGRASVTISQEDSRLYSEIAQLSRGDFFGESALSGKNISSVTVTALSDLKLLVLPIENMQIALEKSTRLRQEIGVVMESRRKAIAKVSKPRSQRLERDNGQYSNFQTS